MRAILGYRPPQELSPVSGTEGFSSSGPSTAGGSERVTISLLQTMHYLDFPLPYRQHLAAYRVGTLSQELELQVSRAQKFLRELKATGPAIFVGNTQAMKP